MKKLLITSVVFLGVFAGVQEAHAGATAQSAGSNGALLEELRKNPRGWVDSYQLANGHSLQGWHSAYTSAYNHLRYDEEAAKRYAEIDPTTTISKRVLESVLWSYKDEYSASQAASVGDLKYSKGTPYYVKNGETVTSAIGKLDTQAKKNNTLANNALDNTGDLQYGNTNYVSKGQDLTKAVSTLDGQAKKNADGIAQNASAIKGIKNDLADNYLTKDALEDLSFDVDDAQIKKVVSGAGYVTGADVDGKVKAVAGDLQYGNTNYVSKGQDLTKAVSALDGQTKKNADNIATIANDYVKGSELDGKIASALTDNNGELTDKIIENVAGKGYATVDAIDDKVKAVAGDLQYDNTNYVSKGQDLTGAVSALDGQLKTNTNDISGIKDDLAKNYATKEDLNGLVVDVDAEKIGNVVDMAVAGKGYVTAADVDGKIATVAGDLDFTDTHVAGSKNLTEAVKNLDNYVADNYISNDSFSQKLEEGIANSTTVTEKVETTVQTYLGDNYSTTEQVTNKINESVHDLQTTLVGEDNNSGIVGQMIDDRVSNSTVVSDIRSDVATLQGNVSDLQGVIGDTTIFEGYEGNGSQYIGSDISSTLTTMAGTLDNHDSRISTAEKAAMVAENNAQAALDVLGASSVEEFQNQVAGTHYASQADNMVEAITGIDAQVAQNANAIARNTSSINQIATDLGDTSKLVDAHYVGGTISTIDGEDGMSQEVMQPTVVDTVMNLDNQVHKNTQAVEQLYANDEALQDNIETLGAKMNQMAASTSGSISALNNKVNKLDKRVKTGFASNAALSALVPNARAIGNTQLSAGTGYYDGEFGGAVGVFHYFNDNVLLNAGVSYAGDESLMARAGVSFGF